MTPKQNNNNTSNFKITTELRYIGKIIWSPFSQFHYHHGFLLANHLTISLFLAMFPLLVGAISIIDLFNFSVNPRPLIEFYFNYWPEETVQDMVKVINNIISIPSGDYYLIILLLAIWIASNCIEAVRTVLNQVYTNNIDGEKNETIGENDQTLKILRIFWEQFKKYGLIHLRIQSFLLILIGVLTIFVLAVLIFPYTRGIELPVIDDLIRISATLIILGLFVLAFHIYLPITESSINLLFVLPGVIATLSLWYFAFVGFGVYLQYFPTYLILYVGLAGAAWTILYLWVLSVLFIFGAEINVSIRELKENKRN